MSFLFGKKKQQPPTALPPASRDTHTPGGTSTIASTTNGAKDKDRLGVRTQTPTPGSSVNNSMNSLGGGATPSPEQNLGARGGGEQDLQVRTVRDRSGQGPPLFSGQEWHVRDDAVENTSDRSIERLSLPALTCICSSTVRGWA